MKKIFLLVVCLLFSVCFAEEPLLPAGSCSSMLRNGKLELEAGDFPAGWNPQWNRPAYDSNGFPQGGGSFKFHLRNKSFLVRQDWTFSIVKGEKYRLSAWVRTKDFAADRAELISYNNGWTESYTIYLPKGTKDWHKVEGVFTGYFSKGGVGSVSVLVSKVKSGELEIANIGIEPATKKAYEASIAYLKEIPPQKLIPLVPKLDQIEKTLSVGWFGDKNVRKITWKTDDGARGESAIKGKAVELDLSKVANGKRKLTCTAGKFTISFDIVKRPVTPAVKNALCKNNFHTRLLECRGKAGMTGEFINPRDGWVSIQLSDGLVMHISGSKVPVTGSMPVLLPAGIHKFKLAGKSGKVYVAAITEVIYYQLAGGPYLPGFPKHSFEMVKKHQLDCITTFNNGSPGSEKNWKIFREKYNNRFLAHSSIADGVASPPKVRGTKKEEWRFDGAILDEFSSGNERQLATIIKNSGKYNIAPGKSIYCWMTGTPNTSAVSAGFGSMVVNELNGKLLYEAYVASNTADEKEAKKLIYNKFVVMKGKFEQMYPGIDPFLGMVFCPSNILSSFSVDNTPDANYKYFLDMQMNMLANHLTFKNIGAIGCWGGNYTDDEVTRWVAALFRHYVIEGKREMLSKKFGWKLKEDHLKNCSFTEGLKYWKHSGDVKVGVTDNFAAVIRCFGNKPGIGNDYAVIPQKASISQTVRNLVPGKLYKLSFVCSNAKNPNNGRAYRSQLAASIKGGTFIKEHAVKYRRSLFANKNAVTGRVNYDIQVFRAEKETAELSLVPANSKDPVALHRVSIVPWFE